MYSLLRKNYKGPRDLTLEVLGYATAEWRPVPATCRAGEMVIMRDEDGTVLFHGTEWLLLKLIERGYAQKEVTG